MRPSTGTTSPGPTTRMSSTTISASGITRTCVPTRRRAEPWRALSSARRSRDARRSASASSARPPASITAINAPAKNSPTRRVPTSDSTAMTSTPTRPRRNAANTHINAGATAKTVVANQQPSATPRQPNSHAIPPAANPPTVNTNRVGSVSRRSREIQTPTADSISPATGSGSATDSFVVSRTAQLPRMHGNQSG